MSHELQRRSLRLVIASEAPALRIELRSILEQAGYRVLAEASDGVKAVSVAHRLNPDLVLLDAQLPRLDGIASAQFLHEERIAPVILLTENATVDLVKRAVSAGVYACLPKTQLAPNLLTAIEIAFARWQSLQTRTREVSRLQDTLTTRELVSKAKSLLINECGMRETEAFRLLQTRSMNTRRSMREVSEAILRAHRSLQASESAGEETRALEGVA